MTITSKRDMLYTMIKNYILVNCSRDLITKNCPHPAPVERLECEGLHSPVVFRQSRGFGKLRELGSKKFGQFSFQRTQLLTFRP